MKRFFVLLLALAVTGIWSCKPEKPFNEKHAELIQNTKLKKANAMTMNEFIEKYDFWNLSAEQMKQLNERWNKHENERPVLKLNGKVFLFYYKSRLNHILENYYTEPDKLKMSFIDFIDSQNNHGSVGSGVSLQMFLPREETSGLHSGSKISGLGQVVELDPGCAVGKSISIYPFVIDKK